MISILERDGNDVCGTVTSNSHVELNWGGRGGWKSHPRDETQFPDSAYPSPWIPKSPEIINN